MGGTKIRDVPKGEYITLKPIAEPKASQVWLRDEYDRSEKKYMIVRFDDACTSRLIDGNREVYTDFTF